jgi:hypothetical protein
MRRAAPSLWQQLPSVTRRWRTLGLLGVVGVSGACSVYNSDLLEEATGIVTGGTGNTGAGQASTLGGTPSTTGGKNGGEMPSSGGDGGDGDGGDPGAGEAGEGGVANGGSPTGSAGAPPTGGGGTNAGGTAGSVGNGGGTAGSSGGSTGPNLVDGFEDDDLTLEQVDGRGGVWYLVGDGTVGTVGPTPLVCSPNSGAPAALGAYAMHITATGFTGSGSILGADLRNLKAVYDASRFTGIRFWAKVGVGKNTKHRVQIADATTDKAGGKCNPAAAAVAAEKCDDHFGFAATFTTSWTQYSITFKEMTQLGWGKVGTALDKGAVYGLQFTAKPKLDVDLWLDQIEFF